MSFFAKKSSIVDARLGFTYASVSHDYICLPKLDIIFHEKKKKSGFSIKFSPKLNDSYIFLCRCKFSFYFFISPKPRKNRVKLRCPNEEDFKVACVVDIKFIFYGLILL